MKKLVIAAALIIGGIGFSTAQNVTLLEHKADVGDSPIKEGNWIVGGSVGSLGYSFEGETFNINIMPSAGYFISDGVAIGLTAGGGLQTIKDSDNAWHYKVAPFVRYYFPEGASPTGRFFGQGDVGISGASVGSESDTSFAFGINAGYAHFITRNVALEAMAGYNYSKSNIADAKSQTGLGVSVGFQIYIPGKGNK
jgi:hypothetical protein